MDHIRRIVFALLVFAGAFFLFSTWRSGREGYGLLNLIRGEKPPAENFTPPSAPRLNLDDMQVLAKLSDESAKLAAAVLPAVVSINTRTVVRRPVWDPFWGMLRGYRNFTATSLGSGAIVSEEGHVVTNFHVIEDVDQVEVATNDKEKYPARVIGFDRERDVALLKIEGGKKKFTALPFANSDDVKVGQIVFAVGNPFGLTGTVTRGIISARDRHLSDNQLDFLQTDTVINPGNSGGPLVNIKGEIVGINVAIFKGEESTTWQGVGLAIPSSEAKAVIDEVLAQASGTGAARGIAYLGLTLSEQLVVIDSSLGVGNSGVHVREVLPGSPAAAAGLQVDDVILDFDGRKFRSANDFFALVRRSKPGAQVKMTVLRAGQTMVITATLGRRPQSIER